MTPRLPALLLSALLLAAAPAQARDALGIFSSWAAFRDPATPLCYAIAQPASGPKSDSPPDYQPYAAIGTWPRRSVHGALHLRLSHRLAPASPITLSLGGKRFHLVGGGGDAWPASPRDDAAIAATLRSSSTMSVSARTTGHPFTDTYPLAGAPTAIDAAAIGCAGLK